MRAPSESRLERFLQACSPGEALAVWFEGEALASREQLALRLAWWIAQLDRLLSEQVNAILHHQAFQRLESSWRGLHYLCQRAADAENVVVRLLNASWQDLQDDARRSLDFDQSQLFRMVYSEEFGMPGGEPFGVLLGDYYLRHRPAPGHPTDDISTLEAVSGVAAAAFAPFVAALDPAFLGMESFADLERPVDLRRIFRPAPGGEYTRWNALRDSEDSRYVGLLLPRVLMRAPYGDYAGRRDKFRFREDSSRPGQRLWGNPVYAFGAVLIRAFADSGWLASIRGVERDHATGGIVSDLPLEPFAADADSPSGGVAKISTEVVITDVVERELSDLGFMSLCQCHGTEFCAFYGTPSIRRPAASEDEVVRVNERISAMLHYMLCVSRFAHYIKVIGRESVGSFGTPEECERFLNTWLSRYKAASEELSSQHQARYPLREARVEVHEAPGQPGVFQSTIHLRPYFQLDRLTATMELKAELFTSTA